MIRLSSVCAVSALPAYRSAHVGLLGPAVKLMFHHYEVDLASIAPTGPKNNILKSDLLSFIGTNRIKPQPSTAIGTLSGVDLVKPRTAVSKSPTVDADKPLSTSKPKTIGNRQPNYVDIPLTNMRLTIAKRLSFSKSTIPHSYQSTSICVNNLLSLRSKFVNAGHKVSVNDLIIQAVAVALRRVPQINVQLAGGDKIHCVPTVDVSVAVATPNGLITPIIFGADQLNVDQISARLRELADRARTNQLKPQEFQGGSFTISNLGMFGISNFTAIINPPQTAILAVGSVRMELNAFDVPEKNVDVTLCFDARAITDATAQSFLHVLRLLLLEPKMIIAGPDALRLDGGEPNITF